MKPRRWFWAAAMAICASLVSLQCKMDLSGPWGPLPPSSNTNYKLYGDIYCVNADGSGLTQLTSDHNSCLPCFSHDGTKIFFTSIPKDYGFKPHYVVDLCQMSVDGTGREVLATDACLSGLVRSFSQSPDGSSLCYLGSGTGYSVVLLNLLTRIPMSLGVSGSVTPEFSADGQRIFFGTRSGIYSVALDGTGSKRHYQARDTVNLGGQCPFSVSPEDGSIVFFNHDTLCIVKSADTAPVVLALNIDGSFPHFSPDGLWVMYSGVGETICKVSVKGGTPLRLANGISPALSADGRMIAYFRQDYDTLRTVICVSNSDGSGERVVVKDRFIFVPSYGEYPPLSFSPDGTRIAFSSFWRAE
jgi:hypothetical protein